MSIAAKCPACGKDYDLAERFAGKKIKCTACSATFGVPAAAPPPQAPQTKVQPSAEVKPAAKVKPAATVEAKSKASDETVEVSSLSPAATSGARRTRSNSGSGSGELRMPARRGGGNMPAPPIVRAVNAPPPGIDGSAPPVRAVQPEAPSVVRPVGPVIATHEPAAAAHRVAGRRSRSGGGLIVAGIVVVGVAATIGILFALGVFDGADADDDTTVAAMSGDGDGDGSNDRQDGMTNSPAGGQQGPGKNGGPANPSQPNSEVPANNGEAGNGDGNNSGTSEVDPDKPPATGTGGSANDNPAGEPGGETVDPGVEPIAPIPAAGTPPNSGKQGGFSFRVRGQPIALYEVDAVIEPKEPRLDIIEPEEITGPKLADGDEFEITCIQKQAFLGFVKTAEGRKPGKISRDDIEFGDEATYLVEDEDSVLYVQNRAVELTRGENHGVTELSVVASSLLEDPHMKHLADLPYLVKATFLDAKISSSGAVHLAGLTNLELLSFSGTSGIDDEALAHFKHLTKLQELRLDGTKVSDAGLGHLAAMPWLKRVVLTNTDVTEEGAKRLKAALKKTDVVR